jgi:uncharacterized protein with von Willebrand factor type A (vWA) domain
MDDLMIGFVQVLRVAGMRVSSSESLDAVSAANMTGVGMRDRFKSALRAALVKRNQDRETFDMLFDAYFSGSSEKARQLAEQLRGMGQNGEQNGERPSEEQMRRLEALMQQLGMKPLSEMAGALLSGNVQVITAEMLKHLSPEQLQQLQNMLQRGQLTRYVLDQMEWNKLQNELTQLARELQRAGEFEMAQQVRGRLWELQELFPKWVAQEVNDAYERTNPMKGKPVTKELTSKEFARFSEEEVRAMQELVDQLARKLRDDFSRRMRRGGTRRLDVTKTLRAAMPTQGVPMELIFREKRRNKLRLAVLCDVSSSVRNASRFMLQLVYSLQQQRGAVRSFVFISDVDEVTDFFERNSVDAAVQMATESANIKYWSHSDFGEAFRQFNERYGDAINSRTTVLILGDARSNFFDPRLEDLRDIAGRARQIIWLNPESMWGWNTGDSIVYVYEPEVQRMVECRNLDQLTEVMDHLTKTV